MRNLSSRRYSHTQSKASLTGLSGNIDLQRSTVLAFAEITKKEVKQVGRDTLGPFPPPSGHDPTPPQPFGNLAFNGIIYSKL